MHFGMLGRCCLGAMFAASALAASTSRTVRLTNKCSYEVYPAVVPFSGQTVPYQGEKGWRAQPSSSKDIALPNTFLGRICESDLTASRLSFADWGRLPGARHGCSVSGDYLYCVTGACQTNKLACNDGEMGGGATSVEFRLSNAENGQYDVYDLNNGAVSRRLASN